jgi:hydrogenase maturation protease
VASTSQIRCLVLACGNTLRGDDGIGPWLADWARHRFSDQAGFRAISRQQWTPELAEDIARAESVLFT